MDTLLNLIDAYEDGDLDNDATVELFQKLVNTGMAWSLQGHYGRTAQDMLDAGIITWPADLCSGCRGSHNVR